MFYVTQFKVALFNVALFQYCTISGTSLLVEHQY